MQNHQMADLTIVLLPEDKEALSQPELSGESTRWPSSPNSLLWNRKKRIL